MLSISPPARGAGKGDYYLSLAREDYYTGGGEPEGRWFGGGAELLGLKGTVAAAELRNLMNGYDPSGKEELVQNAGEEDRQCFWDLTFSAPKSVSAAWSQASPEVAREIQVAQKEGVAAALSYLENNCAVTRRGKGGIEIESVKLVIAGFEHGSSRAQDPQLHTHCLVQNLGVRADGSTGSIMSRVIFEHGTVMRALYWAELGKQLEQRLGLIIERKGKAFELKGVSELLVREFSKRRKMIEREIRERGLKSAKGANVAALSTREVKEVIPREKLFATWREVGKRLGWSTKELEGLIRNRLPRRSVRHEQEQAVQAGIRELTDKKSFFSAKELIRHTAEAAQGRGLGAREVLTAVSSTLRQSPEIVGLGFYKGERVYSTREILRVETQMLKSVMGHRSDNSFVVPGRTCERIMGAYPTLSTEQKEAVIHLTQERGRVKLVSGMAGTGKSFMLRVARECWESRGFKVFGAALAGKAAQGLSEGSGIKSETLHRLISSVESGRLKLDDKTIVVVDEAAMVGTKQLSNLIKHISAAGSKLVLVGDAKQLQSIQAGGAFGAIARKLGEVQLTENRRQEESWAKRAVSLFSLGRSYEALKEYVKRGLVSIRRDKSSVLDTLVDSWAKNGVKNPKDNLILASEHQDVNELNKLAQAKRSTANELGKDLVYIGGTKFFEGDRVLITRNDRTLNVRNGQLGTVRHANSKFDRMTVTLDSGQFVSIKVNNFPHVQLGYAVTTHKAQGMTAKNTFVLVGGAMQDRELTYVQASRGKSVTQFFMSAGDAGKKLSSISNQMSKSHKKELALSVIEPGKNYGLSM